MSQLSPEATWTLLNRLLRDYSTQTPNADDMEDIDHHIETLSRALEYKPEANEDLNTLENGVQVLLTGATPEDRKQAQELALDALGRLQKFFFQ